MLPCVGCVGVVLGGRCWHSPFPLAMACCDSRPGFCCLKSPSVVSLPSFRHPPLGHKFVSFRAIMVLVNKGRPRSAQHKPRLSDVFIASENFVSFCFLGACAKTLESVQVFLESYCLFSFDWIFPM